MSDVGHHMFTKCVFYTPPITEKTQVNFQYQLFGWWFDLINFKMFVITKKKFQIWPTLLIIKMRDQQLMFCVSSRTLLIDVLWRQSMLQIYGCGHKSNAYS